MNHNVAYVIAALAQETGGKLQQRHALRLAESYIELHARLSKKTKTARRKRPPRRLSHGSR